MKTLHKQDQWLIKRWAKACQLEESMNSARQRYAALFTEAHKHVKKSHPALDSLNLHLEPRNVQGSGGQVAFSKTTWPTPWPTWPTGIYIWGITLDELTAESLPVPQACIWLASAKKADKRIDVLRRRLAAKAPHIFKSRRIQWNQEDEDDNRICLWYALPEGRDGLLQMLSNNEQSFVNCIAKHVGLLAAFMPVMDGVLLKRKPSRP